MAVLRTGHIYSRLSSITKSIEFTEKLSTLGIASELLPSSVLSESIKVDGTLKVVELPIGFISNLFAVYQYDTFNANWVPILDYSIDLNKLSFHSVYDGIIIAMPHSMFKTTIDLEGHHIYELYVSRLDSRVYRNVVITSSSYMTSPYVSLTFSFSKDGPWEASITSTILLPSFFMRVTISDIKDFVSSKIQPTEMITITCLTCE